MISIQQQSSQVPNDTFATKGSYSAREISDVRAEDKYFEHLRRVVPILVVRIGGPQKPLGTYDTDRFAFSSTAARDTELIRLQRILRGKN